MPRRRSLQPAGTAAHATADDNALLQGGGVFARQLQMGYTKSLMSNLKDKFQRLEEQMSKKNGGHGRSGSDVSPEEAAKEQATISAAAATVGQPGPGMKPRGYIFTSPWDDRCDFRTGNGGRSVHCYQAAAPNDGGAGGQFAPYNQLLEEQGINLPPRLSATMLSDLRFNLPSTELRVNKSQDDTIGGESKLKGHFAKFLRTTGAHHHDSHAGEDEYDDALTSPFEMNLGGERAGGGNRGNRAKLGKLVIYHEGFKMLDLIVSANVGVWWGAWERSF
ncbi:hypothetical protein NQ176_g8640 [Zarea fungicola]|uniref:Uncharacterized protein n=1 Tax=Zarea fungicola TaxID=93591 RepID=A0ACC1MR48_9HYPO|nr:hypothetical protein NQ176_g8640 [Lecanicillium fungicola]